MEDVSLDVSMRSGFLSSAEFSDIKIALAEFSGADEYAALDRDYRTIDTTQQIAEKRVPVKLFLEKFESLIGRMEAPSTNIIEQAHARLKDYASRLTATATQLSAFAHSVPKVMHFVWVGGSEVGNIQRDYMNIWRTVLAPEGYRFNLWYDSDALLAFEMNRVILDSARLHAMESGGDQLTKPSQLSQMIEDRARVLKHQMSEFLNQPQWAGRMDDARIELMVSAYGKDRAVLAAFRKKYLDTHLAMAGQDLRLRDVRHEFADHFLHDVYQREVGMRGNFAAASDVVRLQAGYLEGGRYSDMDYLPPFADTLGSVDVSKFSEDAKIGVLQLLLNEDDALMPGRDPSRYKDRTDKIPAEHKYKLLAFAREKPGLSKVFVAPQDSLVPQDAIRLGTAQGIVSKGEMNAHFLAHPRSGMTMAYMQMIRSNYDCLYEIERRLVAAGITATDDSRVLNIVQNVINEKQAEGRFPGSKNHYSSLNLIDAIYKYYQDGIRIGARGTVTLTGPGAAAAGLTKYIEALLLPDHIDDVRNRLKLIEGYNVYTEEEMISGWTVNGTEDEWLTKEQEKWKSGKLKSRYAGNLTELLKEQTLTFKQGWPVVEGKPVLLTDVLQQLMNDLGEPFIRAMRDKLSGEITFSNRIVLGFDERQQILAQPDSAIPVSLGAESASNLNELFTRLAHGSLPLEQLSPLQRAVLGGLFGAKSLDEQGFSGTWQKALEVAGKTVDTGLAVRYNAIEKILHEQKTPAFEAGLARGGVPGANTAGELKVLALAEPLTVYQWGQRIAQINNTARRDYHTQILQRSAQVREQFFLDGASSARQVPQDLLARTPGDPGRNCYPLALLMAVALNRGEQAERSLIGRIANVGLIPDDAESQLMMTGLDKLFDTAMTDVGKAHGTLSLENIVRTLEARNQAGVFLLDTGNHALLMAKTMHGDNSYRFFDPNFGVYGFAQAQQLKQGVERYLYGGNAEMARLYGLADSSAQVFNVIELDTTAIADKALSSNLRVGRLLDSSPIASDQTMAVWDRQALGRTRSMSENGRMGASLAGLDGHFWAQEFDKATRRVRSEHKLGREFFPMLETVPDSPQKGYSLTMVDARNPQNTVKVSTSDLRFIKVKKFIQRAVKAIAGKDRGPAGSDGGSRLSFAFAIQTLITETRNREYQAAEGQVPALSIALQVQVYVSYAQLGFGVVSDALQTVSLVRQVAASEQALATRHSSLSGRLLGRAVSAVGIGFSLVNIGFDIHGLVVATNQEQRSRLATQLTFNVAALGLDITALAVGGTAGAAAAVLSVPLLGLGIGFAAIASNLGQISDKARAVGRHLFMINEAYLPDGHKVKDGVLTFAVEAVITELDLQRRRVEFDSQKFHPTIFQRSGLPTFSVLPKDEDRAINIRKALYLPSSLDIAKEEIHTVVLPCTPVCYYGYEYQLGSSGFAPDEDLNKRLTLYQHLWDGIALPDEGVAAGLNTSYPNVIDGWKERLEFDKDGEQRFAFFSTPFLPHILYKLHPFNKPTDIDVTLDRQVRQLVVPTLPEEWKQLISYKITGQSGQYQLMLTPGIVSVTLESVPFSTVNWVVQAPWASEELVKFEDSVLVVDGIRIKGFEGFLQLQDGELFQFDEQKKSWVLVCVTLKNQAVSSVGESGVGIELSAESDFPAVLARVRSLGRIQRLAAAYIPINGLLIPYSTDPVYTTGYYDVVRDRVLYARNLPAAVNRGIVLGGVSGQHAWFYHPDYPTIWRVDTVTGTVNHRYRLMSPKRGSRIIGVESTADGGLRVTQETRKIAETGYTLEYQISGQSLRFIGINARDVYWREDSRDLEYWSVPLSRFRQPQTFADETPGMAASISTWTSSSFVSVRMYFQSEFIYSGWIRLHDNKFFAHDDGVTQQMLMWDQTDNDAMLFYDKERKVLIRGLADPALPDTHLEEVIENGVVEVTSAAGRYIATKDDGRMFEVDKEGALQFIGVGRHWLELHPDWLNVLPELATTHMDAPFPIIGLSHASSPALLAAWCIAGQLLLADIGHGKELALLGATPDGHAAWLLDVAAGQLYRQTLVQFEVLRPAFAKGSRLLHPEQLPVAQKVWSQWAFVDVMTQGQGLLARTREGVNLHLLDSQPARIVGVENQWSYVYGQTETQLRARLKALVSAHAHAMVLPVGSSGGRFQYYVPESDQLFDIPGRADGQWSVFLGVRNATVPMLFDPVDGLIYSRGSNSAVWLEGSQAQRDAEVMSLSTRGEIADLLALIPDGVDKLILGFGSQLACRVSDDAWQRLDCIVLDCRQSRADRPSTLPTLFLDMSANERLLLSVVEGQLVFSDPDNAHSLIVRNADAADGEAAMPMEISIKIRGGEHRFAMDPLLKKVEVEQGKKGCVVLEKLIAETETLEVG